MHEIGEERQRPSVGPDEARSLSFGSFVYDREPKALWHDGEEVALPQRCLLVLGILLQSPGQTVAREHLLDLVWRGEFITDTSLTEAVSRLRQALGDEARQPRYIRTVHGRGYKFIAPVEINEDTSLRRGRFPGLVRVLPLRSGETTPAGGADTRPGYRPGQGRWAPKRAWTHGAMVTSLLLGFVAWFGVSAFESQQPEQLAGPTEEVAAAPGPAARPLYRLTEVTLDGEPREGYGFPPLPLEDLSVDPVGGRLAFSMSGAGGSEIWLLQPGRGSLQRIASGGHFSDPVWTRDGRGLALAHNRSSSIDLMYGEPGSGQEMEVLLEAPFDQYPESWSGDGRSLVYSERHPETGFDLWLLRRQDDGRWLPRSLVRTEHHEAFGAISPVGRFVAYVTKGEAGPEVFVLDLEQPTTRIRVSRNGGHSPFWSAAGDRLHYIEGDVVWTLDSEQIATGGQPTLGRSTPVSGVHLAATSSVGDRFVVAVLDRPGRSGLP